MYIYMYIYIYVYMLNAFKNKIFSIHPIEGTGYLGILALPFLSYPYQTMT